MQDLIGYDAIIEESMREVIISILKKIEKNGLIGEHYFIIGFVTSSSGVEIPDSLKERYPDEMTIAIQHQYRSLAVKEHGFTISLSFGGKFEKLYVPFKAITSFSDPHMNFALKFSLSYDDLLVEEGPDAANKGTKSKNTNKSAKKVDLSAKVVSLDAFRKNKTNSTD